MANQGKHLFNCFIMKIFNKKTGLLALCLLLFLQAFAQKRKVVIEYDVISDSTIYLKAAYNYVSNSAVLIVIDGKDFGTIAKNKGSEPGSMPINRTCYNFVKANYSGHPEYLWKKGDTANEWKKKNPEKVAPAKNNPNKKDDSKDDHIEDKKSSQPATRTEMEDMKKQRVLHSKNISATQIISIFKKELENDAFYSDIFVKTIRDDVEKHSELLNYLTDENSRENYIQEHRLRGYLTDKETSISHMEDDMDSYIDNFIESYFNGNKLPDTSEYRVELKNILTEKISERKNALNDFRIKVLKEESTTTGASNLFFDGSMALNIVLIILLISLVLLIVVLIKRTNRKKKNSNVQAQTVSQNAKENIIVRRKTTSILKKQSLEDVLHNEAYLPIDCAAFCLDSAVRRIYIKNTCIKDIYNLYAEDLRNPDNPNEDGCMVLGRWVYDEKKDEYYVSLEEIVKPGEDAIFKEYELNFGGKIKLKVSERLRRLRRETNLQYDMTCWVHSHPGLGVFFSNADSSVQMQLKHPVHPKFLVAMVIDILTPEQELGIFTFKHDLTINSKADLTKMYSLEELYKWAVKSDRMSFKPEDYYNIMQNASKRINSHYGVELSNGAVIDMCQLQTNQENGLLAWAHGYAYEKDGKIELILKSVSQAKHEPDNEVLGCFINGSHCSIPTIKRIISNDFRKIRFILFYSTSEDVLSSIPVIDGQISMDETYYGEIKLENLKIWTRRKR